MSLVQGQILEKFGFPCVLYAMLGSQGIVVKCTAAIFFPTVHVDCSKHDKMQRLISVSNKKTCF